MGKTVIFGDFEWDEEKEKKNIEKHGCDFETAAKAFLDPKRVIFTDEKHTAMEHRFFCLGKVEGTVLAVRYARPGRIRIIGTGAWRKEKKIYEKKNKIRS